MKFFSVFSRQITLCWALLAWPSALFADYEEGVNAAFDGDFETAFREFSIAAEQGLDLAQYNLAILYFTGQGVARDLGKAYEWTRAAAEQGHTSAQANLGSLYLEGDGVERDVEAAVHWFSRAALAGHANSALLLADAYNHGSYVDRDRVTAHAWASQAVYNEHPEAEALKRDIESRLDSEQLSQARRLFARWQIQ